jgi:hypothetical protein
MTHVLEFFSLYGCVPVIMLSAWIITRICVWYGLRKQDERLALAALGLLDPHLKLARDASSEKAQRRALLDALAQRGMNVSQASELASVHFQVKEAQRTLAHLQWQEERLRAGRQVTR